MKRILLWAFASLLLVVAASAAWYYTKMNPSAKAARTKVATLNSNKKLTLKLSSRAKEARQYATLNKYNAQYCFLIDMSIESGLNRFFVYDLQKDSILDAGLVTHGRCNEDWLAGRRYGNTVGCGCTSLGKYKIGNPYKGRFGLAYKLHGLETTNNNAFKRYVVLHSHECVPAAEVNPYPICQSDGCPTVAPHFLKKLAATIDGSSRPILLWIFE
ncbi:murein L,D-transpeptidase catalytic domain-containing protein [Paraflavitalea sp. CAU 1676]|uniref:murein L,D-transpeptidase catalytic domain-containing protein n=1 Tax=Paraflavitalea sp. CAU 1676 TaxID=3032598 RepID=UPI0023DA25C6|nr:murein L,D-transpeptidase catalytic domain family protein [Paraflavitalea sp. CAU 1676]MDF2187112.1 murein L,D-transpeptidase catalytic domain family protein [Paraflavitalea sp. CAU 1676]